MPTKDREREKLCLKVDAMEGSQDGMVRVIINIGKGPAFDETIRKIKTLGLIDNNELPGIKAITGKCSPDVMWRLAEIPGVVAVERDRRVKKSA